MNNLDEIFRQKYLKYKAKYLELKEQQGGIVFNGGKYIFFFPGNEEKIKGLGDNKQTVSLKTNFNVFTDNIGSESFYYKVSDKPPSNSTFKIQRNLSIVEVKKANLARGAAFTAINIANSSCKQAMPYYKCGDIVNTFSDPNEIDIEAKHYIDSKNRIGDTDFTAKTNPIIEILNKKYNKTYVAVYFEVPTVPGYSTTIFKTNPKVKKEIKSA